jgi:light-regulated signal transduction histidine kinase (bacteriophytochrome)
MQFKKYERVDMNDSLRDVIKHVKQELVNHNVQISFQYLPVIFYRKVWVQQLLQNRIVTP